MGTETVARVWYENQSLSNPYVRVHPSQATTPPYRVLLRCKPPRLARDLARGPRITHTHTRALTAARCLLNTTHISIHRAPPISHHACIIIAYMVGCPARRQIPAPIPLHHTRDAHGHITVIHTLPHSSPKSISELHLRRVAPSRVHLRRSRACKQHTDSAAE